MNRNIRDILLGLGAIVTFAICVGHQSWYLKDWNQGSGKYIQRVNIPNRNAIRVMALGYDNFYADLMTIRAVQMFGSAWDTANNDVEPIYNYFDVLTDLDPEFVEVYELSNIVLSDDYAFRANNPLGHVYSIQLLRKGNARVPSAWRLPYLAMYTALWNMDDQALAKSFIPALERIEDTPDYVLRMEEYIARQSGRYQIAYDVNLKHFLEYFVAGKTAEAEIANRKFLAIIDGWNKLEIARAADNYYKDFGKHAESIEDVLISGHLGTYNIPTLDGTYNTINEYLEKPDPLDHLDEIREKSITTMTGLPPEPRGYWYYIDTRLLNISNVNFEDESVSLLDRYGHIVSAYDRVEILNNVAMESQGFIQQWRRDYDESPPTIEIVPRLGSDYMGGHFVYLREVADEQGTVLPRYFSTTTLRVVFNREPRMKLSGTIDNFPLRMNPTIAGLPDYFTTEPMVWDFEEDTLWALCNGFEPGKRLFDHDFEMIRELTNPDLHNPTCDDHIYIGDLDPEYVPPAPGAELEPGT